MEAGFSVDDRLAERAIDSAVWAGESTLWVSLFVHNGAMESAGDATGDNRTSFLSYSRWSLKRGNELASVLTLLRDVVRPAYAQLPGFLSLTLLDLVDSPEYLVIAAWDTRDDYDNWVRQGDEWRAANADAFKQWQAVMDFEDEYQASILFEG